jgi:2-methylcitrate dehydratase PrpD
MQDGAIFAARCEHPLGSFENPLSRAQVENKFRTYAHGVLPEAHIADVVGAVDRLEDFASARDLMDLLRATPRNARAIPGALPGAMAAAE